jgi:MATE family, multidrug efflux pump
MASDTHTKEHPTKNAVTPSSGTVKEALVMSVPLVISFVSFSLMGIVDALIMGRVGTLEQGAVGLGSIIAWLLGSLFVGTMTVINTFVAQDFGAGKHNKMRHHVCCGLILIPIFTAAVWATLPVLPALVRAFGTNETVTPFVDVYLRIRVLGVPLLLANFVLVSFLRGLGNMRTPMLITVVSNTVNAILTTLLVFGLFGFPALGVAGAALGSIIAGGTETLMYLVTYLSPTNNRLYRTRSWHQPTLSELRHFLVVGFPIGLSWLFDTIAWSLFSIYASTLKPAALAAHMIVFQVMHLSFLPAIAVSVAGTTLVGQYIGAKRIDLARRSTRSVMLIGISYMGFAGLMMAVFRSQMFTIFNPDPAVLDVGINIVLVAALFQPFDAVWSVGSGILRGAGDTHFPMVIMFISGALVFIPGVYLLGEYFELGIVGAWLAALSHGVFISAIIGHRLLGNSWIKQPA